MIPVVDVRPGDPTTLEDALAALHEREDDLRAQIASRVRTPVLGQRYVGRPGLTDYRQEAWRGFAEVIYGLPESVERDGFLVTYETAMGSLTEDFHALILSAPRSMPLAEGLEDLRLYLTDPALFRTLTLEGRAGETARARFLASAGRFAFQASVWTLFKRSGELHEHDRSGGSSA